MQKPKVVIFGCTKFSKDIIEFLIKENLVEIVGIVSSPEYFQISYSSTPVRNYNYSDLSKIQTNSSWHYLFANSLKKPNNLLLNHLKNYSFDVILVVGWYFMVPSYIRQLANLGAWGIHSSLLPIYAGGAPLVWAMINGEKSTGVTLFRLDSGVDDGDIILQEEFKIEANDYISDLIFKSTKATKNLLRQTFNSFDQICFKPQDKSLINPLPQRNPDDGLINLSWDYDRVSRFIRAQSRPYPGAFIIHDDKKKIIWNIVDNQQSDVNCLRFFLSDGSSVVSSDFTVVE